MASTETATAIIAGIEEFKKMCLFLIGVLIISVLQSMPGRNWYLSINSHVTLFT